MISLSLSVTASSKPMSAKPRRTNTMPGPFAQMRFHSAMSGSQSASSLRSFAIWTPSYTGMFETISAACLQSEGSVRCSTCARNSSSEQLLSLSQTTGSGSFLLSNIFGVSYSLSPVWGESTVIVRRRQQLATSKSHQKMKSHFLIKDIALQAGVGPATVDRALNRRGHVRQQTLDRVHQAIIELEKQRKQLAMTGRKLIADFVVEAPQNFLQALDVALAAELPLQRPAVFRIRAAMHTEFPIAAIEQELTRIERRGSDGVIIMAPAAERLVRAINRLEAAGIPVVTFASDSSDSNRTAYVGLDNRVAGGTAAWFLGKWLDRRPAPRVLVTIRNERFRGEEDRETGFRTTLTECLPDGEVEILVEGQHRTTFLDRITETCAQRPFDAVYSIGGGNRGLLDLMDALDRRPGVFIAHDLDPDNRMLLETGRIDMILYHDLQEDIRNTFRIFMARHFSEAIP